MAKRAGSISSNNHKKGPPKTKKRLAKKHLMLAERAKKNRFRK